MRQGFYGRICTGSYAVAQARSGALRKHTEVPGRILFPSPVRPLRACNPTVRLTRLPSRTVQAKSGKLDRRPGRGLVGPHLLTAIPFKGWLHSAKVIRRRIYQR
jgi:hypothetical protein